VEFLIWSGAATTLAGIAALIWCIGMVLRARQAAPSDTELCERLRRALPVNIGALFLSVTGLMLVIFGVVFS